MALSQESIVDPDRGIYVEMEGMVEVRWRQDAVLYKEDLKQFQERVQDISDTFCRTEQAYFYCLLCNSQLTSTRPLRDHIKGTKHVKKTFQKKREIMGIESRPQNAPRIKTTKKERPVVNTKEDLETKLRRTGEPAIGLEYITEYVNPRNISDPRQYGCRLEGCKSAWGSSDDMFYHVTGVKHCRNFLIKLNPGDRRIVSMTRADVLIKAAEWEEVNVSEGERDYRVILRVEDYEKYCQLKNRPRDWSEKKVSFGLSGNANMAPLGSRKRKVSQRESGPPIFDPIQWEGWQPSSKKEIDCQFLSGIRKGVDSIKNMVDMGDDYEDVKHYIKVNKDLMALMEEDFDGETRKVMENLKVELDEICEVFLEKLESEDRTMKDISKKMAELEEEIDRYISDRTTNKYTNIQKRMITLTRLLSSFKPARESNIEVKVRHNARLSELWQQFECRSDNLSDILEEQMVKEIPVSSECLRMTKDETFQHGSLYQGGSVNKHYKEHSQEISS